MLSSGRCGALGLKQRARVQLGQREELSRAAAVRAACKYLALLYCHPCPPLQKTGKRKEHLLMHSLKKKAAKESPLA